MTALNWKSSARGLLVCVLLGVLGTLCGLAGSAHAQEEQSADADLCMQDPECSSHYRQGRRLSKAGQLEAAVEEYRTAYQKRAVPWLLFNIGRTLQKLGRPKEAIDYYERFLATDQNSSSPAQVKARGFLEEARREAQSGEKPAAAATTGAVAVAVAPTAAPPKAQPPAHPIYKRWWFWTAIGAVAAGAVITGAVVGTRPVTPGNDTVYQPMF